MGSFASPPRVWGFQGVSAVGRFNSQLSPLSKIPFEFLSPLSRETHVTNFGSEQVQYSTVCLCVCVCFVFFFFFLLETTHPIRKRRNVCVCVCVCVVAESVINASFGGDRTWSAI